MNRSIACRPETSGPGLVSRPRSLDNSGVPATPRTRSTPSASRARSYPPGSLRYGDRSRACRQGRNRSGVRSPRKRGQARDAQEPVPRRGVPAMAANRVNMQVEPLPASGRREFRDHLLVGPPACPRGGAPSSRSTRRFPRSGPPRTAGRAGCARRRAGPARASARWRSARPAGPMPDRSRSGGSRRRQQTALPATRRSPSAAGHPATATPTARQARTTTRSTGASPATISRSRTGST